MLFGQLSVLCIYGRRSLTPPLIAHAMTHLLGDPTLMLGILYGVGVGVGAGQGDSPSLASSVGTRTARAESMRSSFTMS